MPPITLGPPVPLDDEEDLFCRQVALFLRKIKNPILKKEFKKYLFNFMVDLEAQDV